MLDFLSYAYPWTKSLHVISVIAWMAGLFYLPRLFVYHTEVVKTGSETDTLFKLMEWRLLRYIMTPSMLAAWIFGLALVATPGIVDWGSGWAWFKAAAVLGMTWFHMWCAAQRRVFDSGGNEKPGRYFRLMNEVPTVFMIIIVVAVIARPF